MAYVYRHIRLDTNEPFYIGISKKDEKNYARAYNSNYQHRNKFWLNVFHKTEIEVEILMDDIPYEVAKEKEIEFIDLYKRRCDGGTLVNLTKGGDGVLGFKNEKLAERNKAGNWTGRKHTEETKRIMSATQKGKKFSDSHKKNISEWAKTRTGKSNPNHRGDVYVYKEGVLISKYSCTMSLSSELGISQGGVSGVLTGRRKTYKGYFFTRTKPQIL